MRLLKHTRSPLRSFFTRSTPPKLTIGIRREDPSRIWERRCPLTPDAVEELVDLDDVDVLIQPCDRRIFPVDHFLKAGAKLHPTLEPAHILIGIKETPLNELITTPISAPPLESGLRAFVPRTHLMFSHTIKGQLYNMPLLSRFLSQDGSPLSSSLIDYELLTGADGKRTVGFGWFAGVAGALESLSALAHAHLEIGVASPFLYTPRPHTHPSIPSLREALYAIGESIAEDGTPNTLGPFVIGLTGNGQVSQGVLSILEELPITRVAVKDLHSLVTDPSTDLHKVYLVHASPEEYLSRTDGGQYSRSHYYQNPSLYVSDFATKVAPYLTLLLNGVGWLPGFPRLMTNEQLSVAMNLAAKIGPARFGTIGDISCDIEGGLEFMPRASTLSDPFFKYRPPTLPAHLPPLHIMSVDILPSSLPLDASNHFSSVLTPYLKALVDKYRGIPAIVDAEKEYEDALERATVASEGRLVGKHAWLLDPVEKWRSISASSVQGPNSAVTAPTTATEDTVRKKKRVLMLGSGMVAGPAIEEISKREDVELVVASNSIAEAENLTRNTSNAHARFLDVQDREAMSQLIEQADLVVSLLPVSFHPSVAELCIQLGKDMVTASYVSPAMRALHERAESANVLLLNEIGLDPGIDHCSAHSLLSRLRDEHKRVLSFTSFCGGLPAPDVVASTQGDEVPLGYKFSWSPRGVLNAALNDARFKLGGDNVEIPSEDLLRRYFPDIIVPEGSALHFEGIANRDSLPYVGTYGLGELSRLRTVVRGTLRYPGFSDLMDAFKSIGLLSVTSAPAHPPMPLAGWSDLTRFALHHKLGSNLSGDHNSVRSVLLDLLQGTTGKEKTEKVVEALTWLGIMPLPSSPPLRSQSVSDMPAIPKLPMAPIDLFTQVLAQKLRYLPGERDMVVLAHEIVVAPEGAPGPCGTDVEMHTSTLMTYGTSKASAMATCVGLPVAFAALAVLDGQARARELGGETSGLASGVKGPTEVPGVWRAVLDGLEMAGVGMKERVLRIPGHGTAEVMGMMEANLCTGLRSTTLLKR
ncbi:Saccharopine dehydrogenase-domain-containing protein [Scleroderma yunnanense]